MPPARAPIPVALPEKAGRAAACVTAEARWTPLKEDRNDPAPEAMLDARWICPCPPTRLAVRMAPAVPAPCENGLP
jgi:hypothetical protein